MQMHKWSWYWECLLYSIKEKYNATEEEFTHIEAVWSDVTAKSASLVDQLETDLANKDPANLANRGEALKLLKSQLRDVSQKIFEKILMSLKR